MPGTSLYWAQYAVVQDCARLHIALLICVEMHLSVIGKASKQRSYNDIGLML